ncbi:MAG: SO2930 family diheme c-type cytochrome [Bacteroidota bacterium]
MKLLLTTFFCTLTLALLVSNCQPIDRAVQVGDQPFEKLSDYHFFKGALANLEPNDRVLPYDLNSPLFSDYAYKARFVWMPEGTSAKYTEDEVLDFPQGSVLIKNFYYNHDETKLEAGKKIIETRILINRAEEWEAIGYIWNEEQTEAYLEVVGDIQQVSWTNEAGQAQEVNYIVPNKNQCKSCHLKGKKQIPIGPKVRNLNKDFAYADGTKNQLAKWHEVGYLESYEHSHDYAKVAVWDDPSSGNIHDRALAYLDINCAHCHRPEGSANTSGLHLDANAQKDISLGIYKATVSAGAGTGGHTYSIVPGNPEESIMVYRMNSLNPGAMMPELGRTSIHKEGVALISEWIANMEVDPDQIPEAQLQ